MKNLIKFIRNSTVVRASSVLLFLVAPGCRAIVGLEPAREGDPFGDGEGGSGGAGATSSGGLGGADVTSGPTTCEPFEKKSCYEGGAATLGVGSCKSGQKTCAEDGRGFGPCEGQVLPGAEICDPVEPVDGNCNGYTCGQAIWAHTYGDAADQYGEHVAADAQGNVLFAGNFLGEMTLGGSTLKAAAKQDVFVAKIDPEGTHLWSQRFGGDGTDVMGGVAMDGAGGAIMAGSFGSTIDFGGGLMQSAGNSDIFLAKLDPEGAFLWQRHFGDGGVQNADALAVDPKGNIIVCGSFTGSLAFGDTVLTSAGDHDIFVASFDADGEPTWGQRFGDVATQKCNDVAVSSSGDIFLTGDFTGELTFGGTKLTSGDGMDSYLVKLAPDGTPIFSVLLGGAAGQRAYGVAVGPDGSAVAVGYTGGEMKISGKTLPFAGATDVFVVKLSANGGYLWGKTYGDVKEQYVNTVTIDAASNIYLGGTFAGVMNFGGNPLVAVDAQDLYVAKLAPTDGARIWSARLGKSDNQYVESVALDPEGRVYTAGYITGSIELGGVLITKQGNHDAFLARFEP